VTLGRQIAQDQFGRAPNETAGKINAATFQPITNAQTNANKAALGPQLSNIAERAHVEPLVAARILQAPEVTSYLEAATAHVKDYTYDEAKQAAYNKFYKTSPDVYRVVAEALYEIPWSKKKDK
jgi:hypothetical protein